MTFTVPSYQKYAQSEIIVLQVRKTRYHVLREHTLGRWVFQHASLARWVNIAKIHREETGLKVKCFLFTLLKVPNTLYIIIFIYFYFLKKIAPLVLTVLLTHVSITDLTFIYFTIT